jgi:hypothetical protein
VIYEAIVPALAGAMVTEDGATFKSLAKNSMQDSLARGGAGLPGTKKRTWQNQGTSPWWGGALERTAVKFKS